MSDVKKLQAAITAVHRLHHSTNEGGSLWCAECGLAWPCATIRVIERELDR